MGTVLQYSDEKLTLKYGVLSPLWLTGDIRDMALLSFSNGETRVVVSRNNDIPGVYANID
jgi:hypothetical protein